MTKPKTKLLPDSDGNYTIYPMSKSVCDTSCLDGGKSCTPYEEARCRPDTPEERARIRLMGGTIHD